MMLLAVYPSVAAEASGHGTATLKMLPYNTAEVEAWHGHNEN